MKPGRWQRRHCHPEAPATHIPPWLDWLWCPIVFTYFVIGATWVHIIVPFYAVLFYPMTHSPVEGDTFLERLRNHVKGEVEDHRPKWW